ncbi:MAG TPA: hypothetical protein VIJ25_05290, partial [Methylococcales bacterium]
MPYLGILRQRGPFKETAQDIRHVNEKDTKWEGGWVGVGGSLHVGHGNWLSSINPPDNAPRVYILPKGEPAPIVVPEKAVLQQVN